MNQKYTLTLELNCNVNKYKHEISDMLVRQLVNFANSNLKNGSYFYL